MVGEPNVDDLPAGYRYGVTRYADLILREAFADRYRDLKDVLATFRIDVDELTRGGGSRATQTIRFDSLLHDRGWGKRNITIAKLIDDRMIHSTRGHEIDMFGVGSVDEAYPGIAVEMEWNNKDPFFDRDLINFAALHREGALAVGVIVTRGPTLQKYIGPVIKTGSKVGSKKYGTSTTHWDKLIPALILAVAATARLSWLASSPIVSTASTSSKVRTRRVKCSGKHPILESHVIRSFK